MIISVFDTIFSACTAAITVQHEYSNNPMWELNKRDDTDKPQVMWVLPFTAKDTFNTLGLKTTRMIVQFFFLKNNLLTDNQPLRTPVIDAEHDAMKQFLSAFEASSINPKINSYLIKDLHNEFDENRSGIDLTIDFEFANTIC